MTGKKAKPKEAPKPKYNERIHVDLKDRFVEATGWLCVKCKGSKHEVMFSNRGHALAHWLQVHSLNDVEATI